jgi:hypothetical protein
VAEDWELSYFSPESRQLETITLKAGTLIDAKDYPDREKADAQLKTNVDGHLGHFKAKYLLVHVFFPESW